MSITIVSTLSKPTQTTAVDNASGSITDNDTTEGTLDFASFLLGQLAPIAPTTPPVSPVETDLSKTEITPPDTIPLLATIGLVPQEQRQNTDPPPATEAALQNIGTADNVGQNSLTTLQTTISGQERKPEDKTDPELSATLAADDKPAKFAVTNLIASDIEPIAPKNISATTPFIAPNTELVVVKNNISAIAPFVAPEIDTKTPKSTFDTVSNDLSVLTTATPSHSNILPINNEASLSVPTPIHDKNWASDFGQKIVWIASNDKQAAQLTLNPPHMGPIEVSLTLDKGNATASFVSTNAEVRQTIETALPRLREMFASAGIELGQTNVSSQSFGQQTGNSDGNRGSSQWISNSAILATTSVDSLPNRSFRTQQGHSLVDIFA